MSDPGKTAPAGYVRNAWWDTAIIDMEPGQIRFSGYPIEELIGRLSFAQMIWLMLRGDIPTRGQAELLEAALMSSVDHGPQAPSIAIARIAATCGQAATLALFGVPLAWQRRQVSRGQRLPSRAGQRCLAPTARMPRPIRRHNAQLRNPVWMSLRSGVK